MLFNFVFVRSFASSSWKFYVFFAACVCCCLIGIGWSSNWMSNYRYKCVDEGNFINLVLSLLFSFLLQMTLLLYLACSLFSFYLCILFLCLAHFFIILKNGWEKYPIKCRKKHVQPFFSLFLSTYFVRVCVCASSLHDFTCKLVKLPMCAVAVAYVISQLPFSFLFTKAETLYYYYWRWVCNYSECW